MKSKKRLKAALDIARGRRFGQPVPVLPCDGKVPLIRHGVNAATTDTETIRKWWKKWPDANIAAAMGDGIYAIDVDVKNGRDGEAGLTELCNGEAHLPPTLSQDTPSGGKHFFFRCDEDGPRNSVGLLDGIDIRGKGGYVVVAPSSGYTWTGKQKPALEPRWLRRRLRTATRERTPAKSEKRLNLSLVLDGVPEGRRNDQVFRYVCKLRGDGIPEDEAWRLTRRAASSCNPPMAEREARTCFESAWKYREGFHLTDAGNARRFVADHGTDLRYVVELKQWLVWDENVNRWTVDAGGQEIMRRAKETARRMYAEAAEERDDDRRKKLVRWSTTTEGEGRLNAMISLARTEPGVSIRANQLDTDPWLLGVNNGLIDLRTGKVRRARREDLITKFAPVTFDAKATCPVFERFLSVIFDGNTSLIEFVQRALGYSLTGVTTEQCLFFLHGGGANGKTTLLVTFKALLGDYATQAAAETFMVKRDGSIRNDIARLHGARFLATSETEDGHRLAEAQVKQMTGGEPVVARFLHKEHFEFTPAFKIFLAANHKPIIRGADHAIWRRIRLIPFNVTIPEGKQDKNLVDKLKAELSGILNWALRGCLAWQKHGLQAPAEVVDATGAYRAEMDVVGTWIKACCVEGSDQKGRGGELYRAYREWSHKGGSSPIPKSAFTRQLETKYNRKQTNRGIFYFGVDLKRKKSS